MSYIIKTAAVTQKGANGEFNSDNLNLNGRILSIENANNGFKGAGSMRAPFVVAFASSQYSGFAGAALTALCDRTDALKEDDNRFATVLDGYFADSKHALEQCNCNADGLTVSLLVGYENKLVAAKMGNACILRYTDGDLINMGTEQGEQAYFCEEIPIVNGDMFVLCPAAALSALTEGEIIVALNAADGNEKKAVQMLAAKFAKRNPEVSDTFVVIRVEQQGAPAVVPPVATETSAPVHEEPAVVAQEEPAKNENVYEPETEEYEEYAEEPQTDRRKQILLWAVLCVALVLAMAITVFAAYKISFARNHDDVSAGVVVAGSDAQYDVDIDPTAEVPTSDVATEAVTEEPTSEEATEAPTEAETTTEEDDDDYYYDDDDDYYEDDDDDYYEDDDEATVPETVPRPTEVPTEIPTETPTDAPTDAPTDPPEDNEEEPTAGRPIEAPTNDGTFEEF